MSCGQPISSYNLTSSQVFEWEYENGTRIFCDHPVVCEESFGADPDIGGLGVKIAFMIPAWVTAIACVSNAWYRYKVKSESHGSHYVRLEGFSEKVMVSVGELQLVTATAVLVGGFAQPDTLTFYHRNLVSVYWALCCNGFLAERPSKYHRNRTKDESTSTRMRFLARTLTTVTSLLLLIVWDCKRLPSERGDWDPFVSGKCYRARGPAAPSGGEWAMIPMFGLLAMSLSLQLTKRGWEIMAKMKESFIGACKLLAKGYRVEVKKLQGYDFSDLSKWRTPKGTDVCTFVKSCLRLFFFIVSFVVAWCSSQFLALWSIGGSPAVTAAAILSFTLWLTYDIINLGIKNKGLLIGTESSWGFGQVLPLFLLSMLGFNFFNVAQDTFEKDAPHASDPFRRWPGLPTRNTTANSAMEDQTERGDAPGLHSTYRRHWHCGFFKKHINSSGRMLCDSSALTGVGGSLH